MNKKGKFVAAIMALTLAGGGAAFVMTGCGNNDEPTHTHSYTKWAFDDDEHWKVCPTDGEKDSSTIAPHDFDNGDCECGAKLQTVDVTITDGTAADAHGKIEIDKTSAKTGDKITVTVTSDNGYQLKSLTVNGANVFGAMTGNTYSFKAQGDTTVIAVFEKIASSSVNAVITGKKYGVQGNSLTAGMTVTLSATGRDDVTTTIEADGTIKVAEIAGDNWSVKVDGYAAADIIIPRDAEYTTAIALEYDLMENLSISWGNYDSQDLSQQNDGKVTHKSGYWQWVSTKDTYESVAFTATVVSGGARQGVFVRFKGDSYSKDSYVLFAKENNKKIGLCGAGDGYTGTNLFKDNWSHDSLVAPADKSSYELTVVRSGRDIHFFIDGEYKLTLQVAEKFENEECCVGLWSGDATSLAGVRNFKIEEASAYLDIAITDGTATDAHGSVTLSKTTAKLQESVTVTIEPEKNYKLKDLVVGGVSVLNQVKDNTYTFTALKNTTVVATFEENVTVDSVDLNVASAMNFGTEGVSITLEQLGKKWTGTVASGKVTLGSAENAISLGEHNVYANFGGYSIKLGKVTVEASESDETVGKPINVTLGFTGSGVEYADSTQSANPVTGELTMKFGPNAYNNKYDIETIENGGYFAHKILLTDIGSGKRSITIILRVQKTDGTTKEIKYIIQNTGTYFGEEGKFALNLDDDSIGGDNGIFSNDKKVDIDAYSAALKAGGLWHVLGYDAATGGLVSYLSTDLASMRPVKTWGTLPAGLKVTGMGVGNWFGGPDGTAELTLKYGETMQAIGMALEQKVDVTASVNDDAMGTVALDDADGKYYVDDRCTVTVTASAGYALKSIKVGDGAAATEGWTQDGNVYTYSFTVPAGGTNVTVEMQEQVLVDTAVITISGGPNFDANGATLTFNLLGDTFTGVVTDGTVTIGSAQNRVVIGEYAVSTTVNGITINLGTVLLTKTGDIGTGTIALDGSKIFVNAESAAAGYVLKDLAITLDLVNNGNAYHNKLVLEVPKTDTTYLLYKLSLPADIKTKLVENTDKKINFSLPIVVNGSETIVKFVIQNGTVKYQFYAGSIANFWGTEVTLPTAYWNALTESTGNGIYLAVCVDKNEKKLYAYVGTELNGMRPTPDIGNFNEVDTVGVSMGNGVDTNGLVEGACATVAVKYGTSMEDIGMALEQKVDVTVSVNDEAMGSVVGNGKYYVGDECTVTVTATSGYILKSIKVGDSTAVTTGWTHSGNVYTYKFTVPVGGTAVTATLEKASSANVTFAFTGATLAANTPVELTSKFDGSKKQWLSGGAAIELPLGEYEVFVYGYAVTEVNVAASGEVTLALESVIAYASSDEITINHANGTIAIAGNGINDREPNQRKINAEYVIADDIKNATEMTLTFTVKANKKDGRQGVDWVGSRFGVQIGEGEIGFMVFPRHDASGTASDVAKLIPGTNLALNPDRDGKTEQKWHGDDSSLAWLANALFADGGVQFKVVRTGGVIHIYAKNGENWVQLDTLETTSGEGNSAGGYLTIGNDVKNQIKFTAGGDDYVFSGITVSATAETVDTAL